MSAALLSVECSRVVWGEAVGGSCRLENDGEDTLRQVNALHAGARTGFVVTDLGTGRSKVFAAQRAAGYESVASDLAAGAALERRWRSGVDFDFPHAGRFELKARFHWFDAGQPVWLDTQPLVIEVLPTRPVAMALATGSGVPGIGQLNAAWVDAANVATPMLWCWSILALTPVALSRAVLLGRVPATAQPVLSVQPWGASKALTVAWVDGDALSARVLRNGAVESATAMLARPGHRLIAPLFETPEGADALTLHAEGERWSLMVTSFAQGAASSVSVEMLGPPPQASRSAAGADGQRNTFFFRDAHDPAGRPVVLAGVWRWAAGDLPNRVDLRAAWPGRLLAHDIGTLAGGSIVGAALMLEPAAEVGGTEQPVIRRWRVTAAGRWEDLPPQVPGPLAEARKAVVEAVVRVDRHGEPMAVLRTADHRWWRSLPGGELLPLSDELQTLTTPVDLFWVDGDFPALLYHAAGSGPQIAYFGRPPLPLPPS